MSKPTYKIIKRVTPVVRHVLEKRGWLMASPSSTNWRIFWKGARFSKAEVESAGPNQKLNHFINSGHITKKASMIYNLKQMKARFGTIYDFFPPAFIYSTKTQDKVKELAKQTNELWICKPSGGSRGRGIKITANLDDINLSSEKKLYIVQKYINNPLLIAGYKFDLRLYVLVTSFHPMKIYLYRDGLVRLCTRKFDNEALDVFRHLTNSSINKDAKKVLQHDEEREFRQSIYPVLGYDPSICKRSLTQLFAHFKQQGVDYNQIWDQIKKMIILTCLPMTTLEPKTSHDNCFEVLGFDVMLDDKYNPWLIEVNYSPALSIGGLMDQSIKEPLIDDTINILDLDVDVQHEFTAHRVSRAKQATDHSSLGNFEQIFPFNKVTKDAAANISADKKPQENVARIVEEVGRMYP